MLWKDKYSVGDLESTTRQVWLVWEAKREEVRARLESVGMTEWLTKRTRDWQGNEKCRRKGGGGKQDGKRKRWERKKREIIVKAGERGGFAGVDLLFRPCGGFTS